ESWITRTARHVEDVRARLPVRRCSQPLRDGGKVPLNPLEPCRPPIGRDVPVLSLLLLDAISRGHSGFHILTRLTPVWFASLSIPSPQCLGLRSQLRSLMASQAVGDDQIDRRIATQAA